MVLNVTQMEFKPAREKAKGGLFLSPADSLPANSQSDHPPAESCARPPQIKDPKCVFVLTTRDTLGRTHAAQPWAHVLP